MAKPRLDVFSDLSDTFQSLIPLKGKKPIWKGWQFYCENSELYDAKNFRGCNAGIPGGPANGVIILDVDVQKLFDAWLKEKGFEWPTETRIHQTGSGKFHYFYQYPADGKKYGRRSLQKSAGIDIMGIGGQVVAPGSVHPDTGKHYTVFLEFEIAPAPQWMLDLTLKDKSLKSVDPERVPSLSSKEFPPCIKHILSQAPECESTTNLVVTNIAAYFQAAGYSLDDAITEADFFIINYNYSKSYPDPADRRKHFEAQWHYVLKTPKFQGLSCSFWRGQGLPGSAFECSTCGPIAPAIDGEYRGEAKRPNKVVTKERNTTDNIIPINQEVMETNHPAAIKEIADKPINYRRASMSLREIMEYEFPEQLDVIGRGILPEGGGLIIVGESGVGKSIMTLEWAVALIMEWEILGFEVPKARKVYIFQSENTLAQVKYRLKQIFDGLGVSNPPDHLFFSRPRAVYDLAENKHIDDMVAELKERAIDTFFIDPLSSFHNMDENNNARMRQVLDRITHISRITGAAAIVVHHFGKPVEGRETEYRYRGATSIKDWCDTMLSITIKAHENKTLRNVYFNKIRNGPEQKPLLLERSKGCPRDDNGDLIENFIHTIVEDDVLCPPEMVKKILEDLGGSADSQKEFIAIIMKEADCKSVTAGKCIRLAVERGTIFESSGGRKKKYYVEAPLKI